MREVAVSMSKGKREPGCHLQQKDPHPCGMPTAIGGYVAPTSTNRWFAERYNVNNAWIFNGNNGNLNNNNVNNRYRCQAVTNLPLSIYRLRRTRSQ